MNFTAFCGYALYFYQAPHVNGEGRISSLDKPLR